MAFKLAEAFVELKAKGHAEVVKENEKVKESVKTIGPAADESAKRIERSCVSMTTSFQNTGRAGTETLKGLRKEMMDTALSLEKLADKEKQLNAGGGGGVGSGLAQDTKFGVLGKLAGTAGAAAGLVQIGRAVAARGSELADGARSETLGPFTAEVADFSHGLRALVTDVKTGFVDGLLGLVGYVGNWLTNGFLGKFGRDAQRAAEERRQHGEVLTFVEAERASGRRLTDLDEREAIRNRLNFNGGKESLEAERADLARTNAGGNIERIRMIDDELLALKQRQLQEAKKSENLNETYGAAIADAAEAARQEVDARFRNVAAIEQIGQSELQSQQGISRARQQLNEWIKRVGDKAADPNSPEGKAIASASRRVDAIEANDADAKVEKIIDEEDKKAKDDAERRRQNARGREFDRELRDQLNQPMASISQMGIADLQSALQKGEIAKANEELRRQNQDIADKANEKRDEIVKGTANIVEAVKKITGAVFQ